MKRPRCTPFSGARFHNLGYQRKLRQIASQYPQICRPFPPSNKRGSPARIWCNSSRVSVAVGNRAVRGFQMDKDLFQTALRALQQINKRLPVDPEDARKLEQNSPPEVAGLPIDQIAVEIIQSRLRKRPTGPPDTGSSKSS